MHERQVKSIYNMFFLLSPGYDPSLTLTAPSDGPPSTIGDLGENDSHLHLIHNGNGSVSISSGSNAGHPVHGIHLLGVPAEPPKVPTNYISSAMSTSSGDSSSNNASASLVNFNTRRQSNSSSSGSHPTLKSFSSNIQNNTNQNCSKFGENFIIRIQNKLSVELHLDFCLLERP